MFFAHIPDLRFNKRFQRSDMLADAADRFVEQFLQLRVGSFLPKGLYGILHLSLADHSVQGLATGGPAEAKRLLETFWRRVGARGSPDVAGASFLFPFAGLMAPVADALRQAAKGLSQAQANPLGLNPLRCVLDGLLDSSAFGRPGAPTLVVSATRVRTGEARLFRDAECQSARERGFSRTLRAG